MTGKMGLVVDVEEAVEVVVVDSDVDAGLEEVVADVGRRILAARLGDRMKSGGVINLVELMDVDALVTIAALLVAATLKSDSVVDIVRAINCEWYFQR